MTCEGGCHPGGGKKLAARGVVSWGYIYKVIVCEACEVDTMGVALSHDTRKAGIDATRTRPPDREEEII